MKDHTIKVTITQEPTRGEDTWSYSVCIGAGFHKVGFGHDYPSAARLAKAGVKTAKKYVEGLK